MPRYLIAGCLVGIVVASGCDTQSGPPRDGGVDGDVADGGGDDGGSSVLPGLPAPESLLDPATYDCRAASPPARTSSLPLGCYRDPDCEGLVVIAHRAGRLMAPENTLSAMRASILLGVDMVELDTEVTADGVVVLMHDSDVERTTSGTGRVSEMTLAELRELSIIVEPRHPAAGDFTCERVWTLAEALELAAGRIDVMVDMKAGAAEAALVIEAAGMVGHAVMLASQSELAEARGAVADLSIMVRPHEPEEVAPFFAAFDPPPHVVHIDGDLDDDEILTQIHALPAQVLMDMWPADLQSAALEDTSAYAAQYARGIDIQQSEWPFFPLASLGRLTLP